jgi:hypothetical protein
MSRSCTTLGPNTYLSIRFLPKYLAEQVIKKIPLSPYDNADLSQFHQFMASGLSGNPPMINETISSIINCLYKPGDYTFTENNILMRDKPVMDINISVDDTLDPIGDSVMQCTTAYVICDEGCVNPILDRNRNIRQHVCSWILDTLIKRLDEESVIRTGFFEDCWLND